MLRKLLKGFNDMKNRKNLRSNTWSNMYVFMSAFFVVGFLFFFSTKMFFADKVDILNTEIGKEFKIDSNAKFTIKEWIYDETNNQMQVTLITSGMTDYLTDLEFKSVAKSNLQKELPAEIIYSSNDIYIVNIKEVPKNFGQVALRFVKSEIDFDEIISNEISTNEEEEVNIITSIYADQQVVQRGEVKVKKVKEYALKVTDQLIEETENERKELMESIQKNNIIINRIKDEISQLKEELIYQTTEEQNDTNNKIYNLETEISNYERENINILADVDSLDAKIERLIQRKRDIQFQ